jgi:hypothetical protein
VLASQEIEHPAAIQRLAVRFSRPMTPGDALTTRIRRPQAGVIRFDATDGGGGVVLKDGFAELQEAAPPS